MTASADGDFLTHRDEVFLNIMDPAAEGAACSEVELELSGWPLASCDHYSGNNF